MASDLPALSKIGASAQRGGRPASTSSSISHVTPNASMPHDCAQLLITSAAAAQLLGIGERTLWRWSRSGICPRPIKIGSGPRAAVRYRRAELDQWCADGCPRVNGRESRQ